MCNKIYKSLSIMLLLSINSNMYSMNNSGDCIPTQPLLEQVITKSSSSDNINKISSSDTQDTACITASTSETSDEADPLTVFIAKECNSTNDIASEDVASAIIGRNTYIANYKEEITARTANIIRSGNVGAIKERLEQYKKAQPMINDSGNLEFFIKSQEELVKILEQLEKENPGQPKAPVSTKGSICTIN